jgi:S-formylglutathione hydrolase FrmB
VTDRDAKVGGVVSRRTVLVGGAATVVGALAGGFAAVELGWVPGRVELGEALGRCAGPAPPPDGTGPEVRSALLPSRYRGRDVPWALALPPDVPVAGLPVVLVLHGRGGTARSAFDELGLHRVLARHVAAGGRPFALAAADGDIAYWHPRASGDDPLGMLVHEVLPALAAIGLAVDRIGAWGWSMGGYGALLLARESERDALDGVRVAAAAAASPALFESAGATSEGSFDGPDDFARWGDLLADPGVSTTPLRVVCGDNDVFTAATRRYRETVRPTPAGDIVPGCHDPGYWAAEAPAALAFLADHLG